jgi:ribosomal protein L19E
MWAEHKLTELQAIVEQYEERIRKLEEENYVLRAEREKVENFRVSIRGESNRSFRDDGIGKASEVTNTSFEDLQHWISTRNERRLLCKPLRKYQLFRLNS